MPLGQYSFSKRYGWIQDKYGVSWQIVPAGMDKMLAKGRSKQLACVTKAFLQMKKFDLAALRQAYEDE